MAYWIEFKRPALDGNQRTLKLLGFIPMFPTRGTGAGGPGKAAIEMFRCSREVDGPASQLIARAVQTGQAFAEVILGSSHGSGGDTRTVQFTLMLATIGGYRIGELPDAVTGKLVESFDLLFEDLKQDKP